MFWQAQTGSLAEAERSPLNILYGTWVLPSYLLGSPIQCHENPATPRFNIGSR